MTTTLSNGAIMTMLRHEEKGPNESGFKPILQILNLKPVGTDRFRAVLSDGTNYVQGMLATQLNALIKEGTVRDNCVIRLDAYMKNLVQEKVVIIVLKADIVEYADKKIGEPQDIEKVRKQPMETCNAAPQPLYNSTNNTTGASSLYGNTGASSYSNTGAASSYGNTGASSYGNTGASSFASSYGQSESQKPHGGVGSPSNPYGGGGGGSPSNPYGRSSVSSPYAQHHASSAPIVRSNQVAGGVQITPIAALNIYNNRWTIKARLTSKSDIRTWSNAKGEGSLFSIELLDHSGTDIRGTFFREAVDKFYNFLEVGKVYRITGGRLKVANMQYNTCKSAFEITFDQNTEIHLDNDDGAISRQTYDFVKIKDIENVEANKSIDVLAIVKSVGDVAHIVSKKSGQEMAKCDLVLADDSGADISLTVWRDKANTAPTDFANTPVVAFRRARVSDYGGKSLSMGGPVEINPQEFLPQAQQLQQWWESGGHANASQSLSTNTGGGGRMPTFAERKDIASIKNENLGHHNTDKGDYLSFKATLTFVKKDKEGGAWYPACANAGEPCKNRYKVTQTPDQQWQCDKCQGIYADCVRRWIFSGVVEDGTGSTWVSFFNDQAEPLLGVTADEVYQKTYAEGFDQDAYDSYFVKPLFSEWIFRCKVKNEMVNEESRIKTSVASMWPVDHIQESKDMLAAIEKF